MPSPGRLLVQMTVQRELPAEWSAGAGGRRAGQHHVPPPALPQPPLALGPAARRHELVVKAQRDPLTGVFTLVAELDGEILASGQVGSLDEAIRWVTHPPPSEIAVPLRHEPLLAGRACGVSDALQAARDPFDRRAPSWVPVCGAGVAVSDLAAPLAAVPAAEPLPRRALRRASWCSRGRLRAVLAHAPACPPEELTNRLLTFLLWWFDLTLIAILLFILLRNLLKLALERHYGILGSRFRTKLLLSYLVLILVPTGLLFLLGAALLSGAATSWFSAPVEGMARAGVELADGVRAEAETRTVRAAQVIAGRLRVIPSQAARLAELERLHTVLGNHLTGWLRNGIPVVELVDPRQRVLQRLAAPPRGGSRLDRGAGRAIRRHAGGAGLAAPRRTARSCWSARRFPRRWCGRRPGWPPVASPTSGSSSSGRRSPPPWSWVSAASRCSWCSPRSGSACTSPAASRSRCSRWPRPPSGWRGASPSSRSRFPPRTRSGCWWVRSTRWCGGCASATRSCRRRCGGSTPCSARCAPAC